MPESMSSRAWVKVAFGDVARLSKERSSDPLIDGLERYVGLEHIEPNDLKIRSWGAIADGTTFTSVFRPGQVLFGKRRAYQRKVAVADFSGVCSGDIYVLEPSNDKLLPELLPFICQTDQFFEHAIETSAGSLSPRTNWKSLSEYEFALPPLEEQRRIVEALRAATHVLQSHQHARALLQQVRDSLCVSLWSRPHEGSPLVPLEQACLKIQDGTHFSPQSVNGCYRYITSKNVRDGYLDLSTTGWISKEEHAGIYERCDVKHGDLLLTKDGANAGNIALNTLEEEFSLLSSVAFIRPDTTRLTRVFAFEYLRSRIGRARLLAHVGGSAITRLTLTKIRRFTIPLPNVQVQARLAAWFSDIQAQLDEFAVRESKLAEIAASIRSRLEVP